MFDIGSRLKEVREERGFSQQQLADLVNIDRITISRLENNHLAPSLKTLENICVALNITLGKFFSAIQEDDPAIAQFSKSFKRLSPEQQELLLKLIDQMK